jgi:hypothetical protein
VARQRAAARYIWIPVPLTSGAGMFIFFDMGYKPMELIEFST